ncbi:MAG: PHP domain-containing protein [Ruminococcaceae bacterium]|nr:PHP domain-containing protein [Oscillospiraceae bacterium]
MRQYIISGGDRYYKANLHCHSTDSDGKMTPEELKEIYKSAGYSVLAYSDHNVLIDHSELSDESFLAMTATEVNVEKVGEGHNAFRPCYHINFYHSDPHQVALPCYNKAVWSKRRDLLEIQPYIGTPDFVRDYDNINFMINEYAKHGFIAMLNHPTWSQQTAEDYRDLDTTNIFGMEVYNHDCYIAGYNEINDGVFDTLLRRGHRLFCTATDDNHNHHPKGTSYWDSLGGFVMIRAEELSQPAIYNALKAGDFYASSGPLIQELYVEDDILSVTTSPAAKITLTTAVRQAKVVYADSPHTPLNQARFDLKNVFPGYVRVTVYDDRGRAAWSQPIYGEFSGKR